MIQLLKRAREMRASDLHLVVNAPPFLRVDGEILLLKDPPLTPDEVRARVLPLLSKTQIETLEEKLELCFSRELPEIGYCRFSLYFSKQRLEASVRIGIIDIPSITDLGLPDRLETLAQSPSGLILITGATSQGKTTTLNAIIDFINRDRRCKIITIEDPIEYVHRNIRSIVVQQEIGSDVLSFHGGLRNLLRQNPDVIGIGEMRDKETISAALTAAETGHLVIATLHTVSCAHTISRIIDVFPADQQEQVRVQVSMLLRAIVNQKLLPRAEGEGRIVAVELLIANEAIRNMIRENKAQQIPNAMAVGRGSGMLIMDDQLRDLYQKGLITYDVAVTHMNSPEKLRNRR